MLKARLLKDKRYPAPWVSEIAFPPYKAGTVVPVLAALTISDAGDAIRYWIDTPELEDDSYGIGLYDGDFELVRG
jgi:hypothetical protein